MKTYLNGKLVTLMLNGKKVKPFFIDNRKQLTTADNKLFTTADGKVFVLKGA